METWCTKHEERGCIYFSFQSNINSVDTNDLLSNVLDYSELASRQSTEFYKHTEVDTAELYTIFAILQSFNNSTSFKLYDRDCPISVLLVTSNTHPRLTLILYQLHNTVRHVWTSNSQVKINLMVIQVIQQLSKQAFSHELIKQSVCRICLSYSVKMDGWIYKDKDWERHLRSKLLGVILRRVFVVERERIDVGTV